MIKWIKNRILRWANNDSGVNKTVVWSEDRPVRRRSPGLATLKTSSDSDDIQTDEVFTFKVWSAGGGKIIEFRSYDRKTDKSNNRLHIINDDEDFASELGKIVLLELMRS